MSGFSLAWEFLTVLPWRKGGGEIDPALLGKSMAFFPIVGFLLGIILWGAHWVLALFFPRALADGLIVLLLAVLTGALHLDGLADTLDGLAGKSPEERLRIMKDHRVGAFGAIGLILLLGFKYLSLSSLPPSSIGGALVAALVLSRASMVPLAYRLPYARPEGGLGRTFKEHLGKREAIWAVLLSLGASILVLRLRGALLWLAAGVSTLILEKFFSRKLGGFTGDTLGASCETNEILILFLAAAQFPR